MKTRIKTENQQARSHFGARLLLLVCAVFLGALFGYAGVEYLLSLRRPAVTVTAEVTRALPRQTDDPARMDLNAAGTEELRQARGIGPALAQAIVDYRNKVGGFYYLEELMDVSGIGAERFSALKTLFYCPGE